MQQEISQRSEGGVRLPHPSDASPLVSIITVVFRAKEELERILNNVFTFDPTEFELIVIDGGSMDGTVELLRQWDEKIGYWLSEPDSGIYDAMNKARSIAKGHFLFHLNAGDRLLYLPVKELAIARLEDLDIATFRVLIGGNREFLPSSGRLLRFRNTLHHQGTFYRRETFPTYDTKYKVLADFDLNQRLALGGAKMKIFENVVASHAAGGLSGSRLALSEHFGITRKNYGWIYLVGAWMLSKGSGCKLWLRRLAPTMRHPFTRR